MVAKIGVSEPRGLVIGNSSWLSKLIGLRGNIRESNSLNFAAAQTVRKMKKKNTVIF